MWKVPKWMYLVIIIPFLAVGIGMIVYGYQASPNDLTEDGYPLKEFLYIMGAFFTIMPFISAAGVTLYYKRINDRETNLIEHGIQGEAVILSREQTGIYINELPQVKFRLKIISSYGETYEMEHKDIVSMLDIGNINVGAKLPVFIDPDNPKNILLVYN